MKSIIIYCSKTGNTEKVAAAVQRGLGNSADMLKLDLTTEGIMKSYSSSFTLDLSAYDFVFFGAWTMIMRVHPFMAGFIQRCENLEGKSVAGFITGGAIFSREHARSDFESLVHAKKAKVVDFIFITTLLGPLLTRKKLAKAEAFARDVLKRFEIKHTHSDRVS